MSRPKKFGKRNGGDLVTLIRLRTFLKENKEYWFSQGDLEIQCMLGDYTVKRLLVILQDFEIIETKYMQHLLTKRDFKVFSFIDKNSIKADYVDPSITKKLVTSKNIQDGFTKDLWKEDK